MRRSRLEGPRRRLVLAVAIALAAAAGAQPVAADDGPVLVRDIMKGRAGSQPYQFAAMGDRVIFEARDRRVGGELFVSDGTQAGTDVLRDLAPGPHDSYPYATTPFGDRVLFFAISPRYGTEPFITDGTQAGTRLLKDIYPGARNVRPWGFTVIGNLAYFTADDGPAQHGQELWVTDGTRRGTRMVKDIRPGPAGSEPEFGSLVAMDGILYFVARSAGTYDSELWRSDGTDQGTWKVRDIVPGPGGSSPESLVRVDHRLYFSASDTAHGAELWTSDGTEAGTRLVRDLAPGEDSSSPMWLDDRGAGLGRWLLFPSMGPAGDMELYRTDGTRAGTRLVRDLWPGPRDGMPWHLTRAGDRVFFVARDGVHGKELWVTDGTREGTRMVRDINPGSADGMEAGPTDSPFIAVGDGVYFAATDGTHGWGLWHSDGTRAGTRRVGPAAPGFFYGPTFLTRAGDRLFFAAGDRAHGGELWRYDLPG
jgi:ELWxxDGT repeat protein